MLIQARRGFVGLMTAVAETAAPEGSLRIADNVSLRRAGALQSREGFTNTFTLHRAYARAIPYKGSYVYLTAANAPYTATQGAYQVAYGSVRADILSAVEARGNLYLATGAGVSKLTSATSTSAVYEAGLTNRLANVKNAQYSASGSFLQPNQHVAYRVVAKVTDPNGVVIRTRPTGAVIVANPTAGIVNPTLTILYAGLPWGAAYDIEIYRTRVFPTSVTPDDEMQLVATLRTIANTFTSIGFTDTIADTARGMTLYTSPSRGGAENANDRPPGAACIARFRGHVFYGNVVGPQRITLSYRQGGVVTGSATGIGLRVATGNTTSGSTTITAVTPTTGLQVGMAVYGTIVGSLAWVTAISGGNITLSTPATASGTGTTLHFHDALSLNGLRARVAAKGHTGSVSDITTTSASIADLATGFTAYEVTPPQPGYDVTVVIETVARGGSPAEVRATHGDEMSPAVALVTAATPTYTASEALPHGIAWSEADEPDHVPARNLAKVGDAGKAILALAATRDSLFILKEDGVFRLSGTSSANFRIDPFDTTAICVLPSSVRVVRNTVLALCTIGLVAISEAGVRIVSSPVQNELATIISTIRTNHKTSGLYFMPGLSGHASTADEPNGEYLLGLGTTTPSFGGQALVYSLERDGFTTHTYAAAPAGFAAGITGQPVVLTATQQLEPSGQTGTMTVRVSPHAFGDPLLTGKLWTHVVAGITRLVGASSVQLRFSSTMSTTDAISLLETLELPLAAGGLVQLPNGSLVRHPAPRAHARGWLLRVELRVELTTGLVIVELVGTESRENLPNRFSTHGTGEI